MARLSDLLGGVSRGRGPMFGELDPSRPRHRRYLGQLQATSRSISRFLRHPRVRLKFALRSPEFSELSRRGDRARLRYQSEGVPLTLAAACDALRVAAPWYGTIVGARRPAPGALALAGASAVSVGGPETT